MQSTFGRENRLKFYEEASGKYSGACELETGTPAFF